MGPPPGPTGETVEGNAGSTAPTAGGMLSVTFLDVGQGNPVLPKLPNGATVPIDCGWREGGPERTEDLRRLGSLAAGGGVVVSHADEAQAGGLVDVVGASPRRSELPGQEAIGSPASRSRRACRADGDHDGLRPFEAEALRPGLSVGRGATGGAGGLYPGSSSIAAAEVALNTITLPRSG